MNTGHLKSIDYLDNANAVYNKIVLDKAPHTALDVQSACNCKLKEVLKTLVFIGDQSPIIAIVGGDDKVDIDKLCRVTKQSTLRMAKPTEVLEITFCKVGTVSPFGITDNAVKIMDQKIAGLDRVIAGSGEGSLLIELPKEQLLIAWDGKLGDITLE